MEVGFWEETLKDVITKLEPDLFKRVTGLLVKDFELLVYTGIDKHIDEKVGLYSTVLTRKEYEMIVNQD